MLRTKVFFGELSLGNECIVFGDHHRQSEPTGHVVDSVF
jgi:hypothetical protein